MTRLITTGLSLFIAAMLIAADAPTSQPSTIDINDKAALEAAKDKTATVTGEVSAAAWSKSGKVMIIKFNNTDDSKFTAVVFSAKKDVFDKAFSDDAAKTLTDSKISVTGKVGVFHDTPQIVLNKPDQIKILTPTAPPAK